MRYLDFKNDDSMPALGLGTWKSNPGEVYDAIIEAIKVGYRHIDCAMIYANEAEIGKALNDAMESGLVKREDLWITSKLWCNSHGKENVIPALRSTLNDLQLDYLDLYLVHWPVAIKPNVVFPEKGEDMVSLKDFPIADTWSGMESAVALRLARHIGVSNFSIKKLKNISAIAKIKPEVNQIELHPLLQQTEMLEYCNSENINLTAYSPLGSKDRIPQMKADNEPNLFVNPIVVEIAQAHNCSSAQVLISWAIERETSVIPKSVNPDRIKENFESVNIRLSENNMNQIAKLDKHFRYVNGAFWAMPGSPYSVAGLWDE
ncbi:MAG: aldo/keto reductase [Bacteroidetes bacterium]|nr:MAG: aldo/keto reductase [Bacteroidota bacterium]